MTIQNKILVKKTTAGVLYAAGILFALYVAVIIFKGNAMFDMSGAVFSTAGVCIPIAAATFLIVTTTQERARRLKIVNMFLINVLIFYILMLAAVLFFSAYRHPGAMAYMNMSNYIKWRTNFIPFMTIAQYIDAFFQGTANSSTIVQNLLGNLLLFAPMGFLLPCVFKSLNRPLYFVTVMLVILIVVEVGQLVTGAGSCDVDDIILNLAGGVLPYCLLRLKPVQKTLRKIYVLE